MRKIYRSRSIASDLAHEKLDVWTRRNFTVAQTGWYVFYTAAFSKLAKLRVGWKNKRQLFYIYTFFRRGCRKCKQMLTINLNSIHSNGIPRQIKKNNAGKQNFLTDNQNINERLINHVQQQNFTQESKWCNRDDSENSFKTLFS